MPPNRRETEHRQTNTGTQERMLAATPKQGASMSDDDIDSGGGTSIPPRQPEPTGGDEPSANPPPAEPMPASAAQPSLWERIKKMFGG